MGLASIFTKGVAIADKVTATAQVTVRHYAWIGVGSSGEPVYASPVSRKAIVELNERHYKNATGEEVVQKASVLFPRPITPNGATERREPIDPRDKIVLPSGYTGPIRTVQGVVSPLTSGPYALEVTLG